MFIAQKKNIKHFPSTLHYYYFFSSLFENDIQIVYTCVRVNNMGISRPLQMYKQKFTEKRFLKKSSFLTWIYNIVIYIIVWIFTEKQNILLIKYSSKVILNKYQVLLWEIESSLGIFNNFNLRSVIFYCKIFFSYFIYDIHLNII